MKVDFSSAGAACSVLWHHKGVAESCLNQPLGIGIAALHGTAASSTQLSSSL